MCYVWESNIIRCQQCSETDYQNFLVVILNRSYARPTDQVIAHSAQPHLRIGDPQPSRHDSRIDLLSDSMDSMAENPVDREQALATSRRDTSINEAAQRKRHRTATNQGTSSRNHTVVDGTAQHKRQRIDADQALISGHDSCANDQHQPQDRTSSMRQGTRVHAAAQLGQQTQVCNKLATSRRDARNDRAERCGQGGSDKDLPSSSRQHTITDMTDEEEHQGLSQQASQNRPDKEEVELLMAGMKQLPRPCWGDQRVICPLLREQLKDEEFFRRQEQQLNDNWGPYAKEREALGASHTPEAEESWTPKFENVEREKPLWDEIWERSVLGGEACMRNILDEDETWPLVAPEEADVWTGEPGGMLSSAVFKQLLRVFTLEQSLWEYRLERSDESSRAAQGETERERDEVTQSFSDEFTSADYPPLASQPHE